MCGGFGSLAQQGFLTPFAARERSEQAKGASSKKWRSHFFDSPDALTQRRFPRIMSIVPFLKRRSVCFHALALRIRIPAKGVAMLNPRLLVILSALPDGEAALSAMLNALANASRPYGLRFAVPERFAEVVADAALPPGVLNAGDVKFYSESGGLSAVLPLLADETHFLRLMGSYAFSARWDAALYARYAKIPARRAVMTAVILGEGGDAQAYLPAFRGEVDAEGAALGAGLALVRSAAPVKTMLAHPAFLFGETAFLREATPDGDTLSLAAYAAGYDVYALDYAPLWPVGGVPPAARLVKPPSDRLPSTSLRRFEQLAGLSYAARTASVRARHGVFGVQDAYPQRMPPEIALRQRARRLLRRDGANLPLTVTAFIDLPDASHATATYLLRFSFLKALDALPLVLYTGGEAERALRARFSNTLAYPDNALLPRALLAEGMTPRQLFERNKLLLLERASRSYPDYETFAWLDLDALPHPVCPQAVPDCAAFGDGRAHIGWVDGGPDTAFMVVPRGLLAPLAREVRTITQLDVDLKRSFSQRHLFHCLMGRFPDRFVLHPLPEKGLLFPSCFPPSLLSAPNRRLLAALPEPLPPGAAPPGEKEEDSDA
jgi:hypothetical protein